MENEKEIFLVLVAAMAHALVLRGDRDFGTAKEVVEDAAELANCVMELTSAEFSGT